MKKVYTTLFYFVLFASGILAQDVLDKASDKTCDCIEDKIKKNMDSEKLTMVLGLCMLDASSDYKKEVKKKYKIDLTNEAGFAEFAELLGERMASRCDKFMEIVFQMVGDEDSKIGQEIKKEMYDEFDEETVDAVVEESNSYSMITAEILDVKEGNILVLKCKVEGKLLDLYCIESFEGADVLKDLDALKNKSVLISTREKTIYSSELKTFITVEELKNIKLIK